jgi:hypothetical protein
MLVLVVFGRFLGRLKFTAELGRSDADDTAEDLREVALVDEAGAGAGLKHTFVGIAEDLFSPVEGQLSCVRVS